jgi:hypothetical protein
MATAETSADEFVEELAGESALGIRDCSTCAALGESAHVCMIAINQENHKRRGILGHAADQSNSWFTPVALLRCCVLTIFAFNFPFSASSVARCWSKSRSCACRRANSKRRFSSECLVPSSSAAIFYSDGGQ